MPERNSIADSSPARLYCVLVGAAVAIAGLIGFFYSSGFETGVNGVSRETDELFGILAVNGWHNLLHLALGLLGLAAARTAYWARTYALAVGLAYVLLAIWGLAFDDDGVILGLLPLNDEDNVLHLILGLTGLGAGAATPPVQAPVRPRRPGRKPHPKRRVGGERSGAAEDEGAGRRESGARTGRAGDGAERGRGARGQRRRQQPPEPGA